MRDYYEELWSELPDDLQPPDRALRTAFLHRRLQAGERVLDLGCGDGWMTAELARGGHPVIGVDVAQAALDRARARDAALDLRLVPFDGPLPLQDNCVDVVWASEVIEHVVDTARWLSEARRVLVPGGRLLATTPNHSRLRLLLGGIERYAPPLGDHLHLYTARSLRETLADLGFAEIQVAARGGPPLARRLLLAEAVR